MDIHNSLVFPEPLTPLELTVCHALSELFLDTDISFCIRWNVRKFARLPVIEQISALLWGDGYPIFV